MRCVQPSASASNPVVVLLSVVPDPDAVSSIFDGKKLIPEIVWSWPRRVLRQAYVVKFQSLIERSTEEEARCDPFGVKDRSVTVCV